MFKLVLQKAEEREIKWPTSAGSLKKQEISEETSISAFFDYAKIFDYVDHNKLENSEIDGNTRPPDLPLEKLHAGQEATVRIGHGTTDWFQIGKGVRQGCVFSPCVFNLYAEYIMRIAGLEEAQLESRFMGEISIT